MRVWLIRAAWVFGGIAVLWTLSMLLLLFYGLAHHWRRRNMERGYRPPP